MRIRLPKAPIPIEERKISFDQIGARWRTPAAIAKFELEKAGVPIVDVEQKPRKGVLFRDLLAFEAKLRAQVNQGENQLSRKANLEVVR
jgi:hypothetical protein